MNELKQCNNSSEKPFSNHTFHNSNTALLQRFKANSSHPEHWCLTGKLIQEVKVRLLAPFPAGKGKSCCLLLFYDLPQTGDNSEYMQRHDLTVIPSDMEIINSCPIIPSSSLSLKKAPLPETKILSLQQYSSLISDAIQTNMRKKVKKATTTT